MCKSNQYKIENMINRPDNTPTYLKVMRPKCNTSLVVTPIVNPQVVNK